jgi:hypothetical protein
MGRVLVKSSLPSKVLVKFDDDYEYAYDANNNIVLVQSPKSRGRPTTRGERVASVVGNVAGVGRSLLQPANTFSQFLSNLRTGAQLGGQDARSLFRNFGETRGARKRAENRQAAADKQARQDELFRQAVERGQIGLKGFRFGGPTRRQREQGLDRLRDVQDTAGQRRKEMEALGERLARDAEPTGQDPSDFYGSMKQIVGQVPDMAGDSGRIDVPTVALPPPTEQQTSNLLAELQRATAPRPVGPAIDIMPQEGDVNVTKPGGVRVVNALNQVEDLHPAQITPVLSSIPDPPQGASSATKEEEAGTPSPNTTVNTAMNTLGQMKPEPDGEEEQQPPSMLSNIQAKMKGYTPEVEA